MIAAWMLYCTLCAAGLAAVALFAERALSGTGASIRYVWVAAMILSVGIPATAFRFAPRENELVAIPVARSDVPVEPSLGPTAGIPRSVPASTGARQSTWNGRATIIGRMQRT